MNKQLSRILLIVALTGILSAGCASSHVAPVAVSKAPPPPPTESIPPSPGINYVWVRGYYTYNGTDYEWFPGRWAVQPRPNAIWVPGTWNQTDKGWVWTPGRWM